MEQYTQVIEDGVHVDNVRRYPLPLPSVDAQWTRQLDMPLFQIKSVAQHEEPVLYSCTDSSFDIWAR